MIPHVPLLLQERRFASVFVLARNRRPIDARSRECAAGLFGQLQRNRAAPMYSAPLASETA
jgi:hypothetical protein